ncbi:phosphoenolpyruvate carboxylase [Candidatus Kuenenbacteria bacterium CG_4_9_14_3_um_filter_39_14]|uniref:Phosphoenolpyruvate carboxylase n=6 Tax=Candidatus Kueneniibacteriota TaxID=1752740 RepID=A0A2M7IL43_9BACT|nr:phosphoenolpyruvate carboxylase [Candidatus Kuenenbacteria bacterium]OIP56208.1 MAG: phosphoenolpyruvate carboxylase [Candidatus Kuenenbacteria bacterium CG2_30_39_24]PIP28898.1 MAG: phosphoenolpyruvate carboxylase [Candidatus Kuenenbacteria bacterium CG23_combo_of_CG06-09_8_20_14_all_39_39]PIP75973.1 MAG: phosphoenolpyruvate carboxylase [Candidatus Kuenenbacteria bacterium CG22_combo_CG10-13_8_21_14_all_39_9]PIW95510.1 MAG: phosphoenolpyruvate carboxylase [Candidatus Kuenenbacteria bacteriu
MRHIPATMATQHPDNACAPYWETDGNGFVNLYEELRECLSCYRDLGVDEFMWDWEGKYADEAVIDKLFSNYFDYFKKNQLGRDKFLTFRLPNVWHEKGYSLLRALMVILTSEDFARDIKFYRQPLFEVILPMCERAEQLIYMQKSFQKLARFKSKQFEHRTDENTDYLEIIPLIEDVKYQANIAKLLNEYLELHQRHFKRRPKYLRVFLARSDPALSSGLVANVLANKIALSEINKFAGEKKISIYPILGAGSLVFRGGLNPENVKNFVKEYAGVKTVTIQSGFRYDYPLLNVKKALNYLKHNLQKQAALEMTRGEISLLKKIINQFEHDYQAIISRIAADMAPFFEAVPSRRERRLHIGFLSYRRQAGKNHLPRAIAFTAAFYSIGVPPEFIGLGNTFKKLSAKELALVGKYYVNLVPDLVNAGRYLNRGNLAILIKHNQAWAVIEQGISLLEKTLGINLGPKTQDDWLHKNITANVLLLKNKKEKVRELMIETGKIRQSLG